MADGAVEVLFTGLDRGVEGGEEQDYERALPIAEAEQALLAWEMNGAPLPPQHGFPLRLVVPGWYGMQNVKWLARITLLEEPFAGYQNAVGYRLYDADGVAGEPVTRMLPRSLMVPPGVPDFMTRERHLEPGPVRCAGALGRARARSKAWRCPLTAARASPPRSSSPPLGPAAWRGWRFHVGRGRGRARALLARDRRGRQRPAARAALEPQGLRSTTPSERIRVVVRAFPAP